MPITDQGVNLERYMLIPRTLILLTRGDKILLIRGSSRKRLWANLYNGVGGHIEPGEDVHTAARRELIEETGLVPDDLWLCCTVIIDTAQNPGIIIFIFRGECSQGEPHPSSEGTLEWITLNQLDQLPVMEDLPILLARVMPMRKGDPPLAAYYQYGLDGKLIIRFYNEIYNAG